MEIITHPSPNCNERRHGGDPDMVVLHYTAMQTAEDALARLCCPEHEVSAHYLISETGQVWQMVDENLRAWHAGAGAWGEITDVNSHSIGIELANPGDRPFPEAQMVALEELLGGVLRRWDIAPERVIAHSDMAPDRKFDPGPKFDWRRLALGGLSVWPSSSGGEDRDLDRRFQKAAHCIGYRGALTDVDRAFRARFGADSADGPIGLRQVAFAEDLALRFPSTEVTSFAS